MWVMCDTDERSTSKDRWQLSVFLMSYTARVMTNVVISHTSTAQLMPTL